MLLPRSRRTFKLVSTVCVLAFCLSWFQSAVVSPLFAFFYPPSTPVTDSQAPRPPIVLKPRNIPNLPLELKYRRDGLVEVNEEAPHPIYDLIAHAEREWNEKIERASRNLPEAVKEYRRRYHRPPPLGFDKWWNYAVENNVQLPDEYDSIFHDLEPFWGLESKDLVAIRDELGLQKDTYTLGQLADGTIGVVAYSFNDGMYDQLIKGAYDIMDILREVEHLLPPFRAVFSPHDNPYRLSDHGVESAALQAAASGSPLKRSNLPKAHSLGWASACAPNTPARLYPLNLDIPPKRKKKTFIYDHQLSMDPCLHPHLLHQHGQFLAHDLGPSPQRELMPEFSSCSTVIHHNIRAPNTYGWVEDIPRSDDPEWDDKLDERLLWRGSNTGISHAPHTRWKSTHRISTVRFANDLNGTMKVLVPTKKRRKRVGRPREMKKAKLNPAMMDVAFVGEPIGCEPESTCEELAETFPWVKYQNNKQAGNYKYVLDIDGNGWSGRFQRLMMSNALIFKATIYPDWYVDRIAPWVHYVPIQIDMSDLYDALLFFRGDGNGDGAHEDLARKIAVAGREWTKTFWRREDIVAYYFRLMLEYARLTSLDRDAMSYYLEVPSQKKEQFDKAGL